MIMSYERCRAAADGDITVDHMTTAPKAGKHTYIVGWDSWKPANQSGYTIAHVHTQCPEWPWEPVGFVGEWSVEDVKRWLRTCADNQEEFQRNQRKGQ